jgi:hypothetical protein
MACGMEGEAGVGQVRKAAVDVLEPHDEMAVHQVPVRVGDQVPESLAEFKMLDEQQNQLRSGESDNSDAELSVDGRARGKDEWGKVEVTCEADATAAACR